MLWNAAYLRWADMMKCAIELSVILAWMDILCAGSDTYTDSVPVGICSWYLAMPIKQHALSAVNSCIQSLFFSCHQPCGRKLNGLHVACLA